MKFGVTLAFFLALIALAIAFKTENRMQLRQDEEEEEEEELTCDSCTPDYCASNFYNWAGCCLGDDACADDNNDISIDCCRFPRV